MAGETRLRNLFHAFVVATLGLDVSIYCACAYVAGVLGRAHIAVEVHNILQRHQRRTEPQP